jgi:solute carrier family 25 carnitine/acylcarnitine transporter 20/29
MSLRALYPAHRHPDSVPDEVVGDTLLHRPWAPLLAGAAAGIIGWIATFPFDILKTRLRVGAGTGLDTALGTSWRTARRCTPNMANASKDAFWCSPSYAAPVNMAMFSTFEGVL